METMVCPKCKQEIVPKVTQGRSGMHSRICPMCGKNVDSVLDQDVDQITIRTSKRTGLIIAGILAVVAIVIAVVLMNTVA